MIDEYMRRSQKEQRAAEFNKLFEHVPIAQEEEFSNVLGKRFAEGTTRNVFLVVGRGDVVIKCVKASSPFNNWQEFIVWNAARTCAGPMFWQLLKKLAFQAGT